ncbi:hypothetical protein [Trinickia fusca]|uniref:hypothetical protein n=1 Tax=Trinickia fusca TaxID=2419777 RepID=UPI0016020693|nr:hypothetical protein [Trinickia fusca]
MTPKDDRFAKDARNGDAQIAASPVTANAPPPPPILGVDVEAVMQSIKKERDALSSDDQQFLDAHLIANASHALNERIFREVRTLKPLTLTFANLRANSKAFLTLQADQEAMWSDGSEGDHLVGLSVASRIDPVLYVSNFLINAREMYFQTYNDAQEIQVSLYLRTDQPSVRGRVDLPPGASVTLESNNDRSTVIGMSSFAIELG